MVKRSRVEKRIYSRTLASRMNPYILINIGSSYCLKDRNRYHGFQAPARDKVPRSKLLVRVETFRRLITHFEHPSSVTLSFVHSHSSMLGYRFEASSAPGTALGRISLNFAKKKKKKRCENRNK